jgi:hypothetical protein
MSDLSFRRHQVPLTLRFAITDYKCQGSTFVNLIVDLKFPAQRGLSEHKKWTSINVQLGRLRSLSGVWLREPITLALHPGTSQHRHQQNDGQNTSGENGEQRFTGLVRKRRRVRERSDWRVYMDEDTRIL